MHRLCVIGNSHLAAILGGWRDVAADFPGVAITFVGALNRYLVDLMPHDGALTPQSDALREKLAIIAPGLSAIDPDDFDSFWLVGLGFGLYPVMEVYYECWAEAHRPDPDRLPVSDRLFAHLAYRELEASFAIELHRRLRSITDKPIRLIAQPHPSAKIATAGDERSESLRLAERNDDSHGLAASYRTVAGRIAVQTDLAIFGQPPATCVGSLFSDVRYGTGVARIDGLNEMMDQADFTHMNAAYGAAILRAHLSDLIDGPVECRLD